jgi:PEP-CTERM motif
LIMKKLSALALFVLGLSMSPKALALGTLQVSNLGQTPTTGAAIGGDSWIAQGFFVLTTDPTVYQLNAVQLLMNPASGNPSGFTVSIYDNPNLSSLTPLNFLGSLTGPNPSAGGTFTYTTPGITIAAGSAYFVVVAAATPVAQGSYNWSAYQNAGDTISGTWVISDIYASSSNGSAWTGHSRQDIFQMALYTTPTPEPGTLVLAGIGLACLSFHRRKR